MIVHIRTLGILFAAILIGVVASYCRLDAQTDSSPNHGLIQRVEELKRSLAELEKSLTGTPPVGTIIGFGGNIGENGKNVPAGWEICDGREVSKEDAKYSKLFEVIGTAHGGNGNPKFNLPDYRGMFLRGVDQQSRNDDEANKRVSSAAGGNIGDNVGTYESDQVGPHSHVFIGIGIRAKPEATRPDLNQILTILGSMVRSRTNLTPPKIMMVRRRGPKIKQSISKLRFDRRIYCR